MRLIPLLLASLLCVPTVTLGQAPGVPVEPKTLPQSQTELLKTLDELRESGQLVRFETILENLKAPTPEPVHLPKRSKRELDTTALAERLHKSVLRIGWYYLCNRCDHWHVTSAGGYVIASDGVAATCYHVMNTSREMMREGYAYAATMDGKVYPITKILASDTVSDYAVVRLGGASGLSPLAFNDQTKVGQRVYLLSDPGGHSGYFSDGIVNRFYWEPPKIDGDPNILADARYLRLNVSTDWSPGSSGSPVVDAAGNVVGHVSRISTLPGQQQPAPQPQQPANTPPTTGPTNPLHPPQQNRYTPPTTGTQIIFHDATPVRPLKLILEGKEYQSKP